MARVEEPPLPDAGAVADVVRRMRAGGAGVPARDGVAVFNRVYLRVTRALHGRLIGDGGFAAAEASRGLTVRFAGRYLDAVEGVADGRRAPACRRPLFAARGHPGVSPLQFALAGVNAHVGHDLPLALVDTCRARGVEPALLEADFDRVGELLTALEERVREDLMPGPDLLDVAGPLTHLVESWSLERAREAAWAAFRALWGLRSVPELAEEFTDRMDAGVGLVGRCLLTPLGCGRAED
ncbi:DUF5995 family protein [Streptomyces sp. DSM 42041]|uniref:DUF5995 family protein n=1 Tax=Streptomyces hazeniae TaxID=3075538 RepID=A0ABU2NZ11_9ACTN|nr:DUF5995 family protein [Streptomyces sp. DSM 42041]MDT0382224.1 DUF5995 family protein [Streptomyces sp. DSM 42041]